MAEKFSWTLCKHSLHVTLWCWTSPNLSLLVKDSKWRIHTSLIHQISFHFTWTSSSVYISETLNVLSSLSVQLQLESLQIFCLQFTVSHTFEASRQKTIEEIHILIPISAIHRNRVVLLQYLLYLLAMLFPNKPAALLEMTVHVNSSSSYTSIIPAQTNYSFYSETETSPLPTLSSVALVVSSQTF